MAPFLASIVDLLHTVRKKRRIHRLESLKFGCGVVLTLPTSGDPPVDIDPYPDTIFGAIKGGFTSTNEEDIQEAGLCGFLFMWNFCARLLVWGF